MKDAYLSYWEFKVKTTDGSLYFKKHLAVSLKSKAKSSKK